MGDSTGSDVAILTCGPPKLVEAVQTRAQIGGFDFHKETFHF